MQFSGKRQARRGNILPFLAVLLIPLVGMMAFAVDVGVITVSTAELQSAADAAALAAADPMMDGYVRFNTAASGATASVVTATEAEARAKAREYAAYHRNMDMAAGVALPDADVSFGYTDKSNIYHPLADGATYNGSFPNTVTVVLQRNPTAGNGQVRLIFGSVFGWTRANVNVQARAVIFNGRLKGLPTGRGFLPLALDYNSWNAYVYSQHKDDVDPQLNWAAMLSDPKGTKEFKDMTVAERQALVSNVAAKDYPFAQKPDSGGLNQLQAFPSPTQVPGNFGWLSLNNNSVSANSLRDWINEGLSTDDIRALQQKNTFNDIKGTTWTDNLFPIKPSDLGGVDPDTGIALDTLHNQQLMDWQGTTGFKSADLGELEAYLGTKAFLPLFDPANGQVGKNNYSATTKQRGPWYSDGSNKADNSSGGVGSNSFYNIVDYKGVQLSEVIPRGNGGLWLKPAAVMPQGANFLTPGGVPAGEEGYSDTFALPRLVSP